MRKKRRNSIYNKVLQAIEENGWHKDDGVIDAIVRHGGISKEQVENMLEVKRFNHGEPTFNNNSERRTAIAMMFAMSM